MYAPVNLANSSRLPRNSRFSSATVWSSPWSTAAANRSNNTDVVIRADSISDRRDDSTDLGASRCS
jgi:hypothetical protein